MVVFEQCNIRREEKKKTSEGGYIRIAGIGGT